MKLRFIDTNIFIRFITKDDPRKAEKCFTFFKRVSDKKIFLTTTESVLSEVIFILSSKALYNLTRERIRDLLLPIINLSGFKISFKKVFINALEIYAGSRIDFEDCLTVSYMKQKEIKEIYSYDRDFDKFSFIKRLEP